MPELPLDSSQRAALATGAPAYLLVNPIEYHGPHLSLLNDHLISEGLAQAMHARFLQRHPQWPLVLLPDLDVGVDPAPGPGSHPQPFATVRDAVTDACAQLAAAGAQRVVLMTFHGSPLHSLAIDAGAKLLAARGIRSYAPMNTILQGLLARDTAIFEAALACIEDSALREELLRELPMDYHAGFFETSIALHFAPQSVRPSHRILPRCPTLVPQKTLWFLSKVIGAMGGNHLEQELELSATGKAWYALRPFPGYTGQPAHARADVGAALARIFVERFTTEAQAVFDGTLEAPEPIMKWFAAASLGGRILSPTVPITEVLEVADA